VIDPFVHSFCDKAQVEGSPWKECGTLPHMQQKAIINWDTWWAQRHERLIATLKKEFPCFFRVHVPGACIAAETPEGTKAAQWVDAGPALLLKSTARGNSNQRIMEHVVQQLTKENVKPENVTVPTDMPTLKRNLFTDVCKAQETSNSIKAKELAAMADKTTIKEAWNPRTQQEAVRRAMDLFPNLKPGDSPQDQATKEQEHLDATVDHKDSVFDLRFLDNGDRPGRLVGPTCAVD